MTELAIDPTSDQIKAFLEDHPDGEPVFMLNLLKFKDRATYYDGEDVSGAEAYARYAKAFAELIAAQNIAGAHSVFGGKMGRWLIGHSSTKEREGEWDAVAIFRYPDAKTMFACVSSDDYRKIHKHRKAGLAGQLLIACDGSEIF
jgi:uncharacterized protein (DUF1330 family)